MAKKMSGTAAEMADVSSKPKDKRMMPRFNNVRRLLPYMQDQRKTIIIALIFIVLSALSSTALIFLLKTVVDRVLDVSSAKPDDVMKTLKDGIKLGLPDRFIMSQLRDLVQTSPNSSTNLQRLNLAVLAILGVGVVRCITDFGQTYYTQRIGQRVLTRLRADLFKHFQSMSVGFFEKRRTGEVMSRLTNDLSTLQSLMTTAVVTSISAPLETIGALFFLFRANWKLSLLVFLVLPPTAFLVNRAGRRIRQAISMMQKQSADMTNYLQEKISAIRLIQTFGTQPYEIAVFDKVNEESYRRAMTPIRIRATLAPVIEFIGLLGVLLALWVGARTMKDTAALFIFLLAAHRVASNLKGLAGLSATFNSAEAAADRLYEILDTKAEISDKPGALDLKTVPVSGHMEFQDVHFAYNKGSEVLSGISFEIKPGEVLALAGQSGSGKTTISNLVPRLYDPTGGRVLVDGHDLRDVQQLSLRAHIGAVPQETTLFYGTIAENICYGTPDASREQIIEAARRANAHKFIEDLPEGYDTHSGERGLRLSGGQRQRIAIARALLRDPKILILDEATSALDADSESLVQDALNTLMSGRTTLIIAHRFSTIRHAHRILVLEKGRIAETGTHEELLAQNGIYAALYAKQGMTAEERGESEEVLLTEDAFIERELKAAERGADDEGAIASTRTEKGIASVPSKTAWSKP
jgi:subfamily B ATP-binding cassette protein MsbA